MNRPPRIKPTVRPRTPFQQTPRKRLAAPAKAAKASPKRSMRLSGIPEMRVPNAGLHLQWGRVVAVSSPLRAGPHGAGGRLSHI